MHVISDCSLTKCSAFRIENHRSYGYDLKNKRHGRHLYVKEPSLLQHWALSRGLNLWYFVYSLSCLNTSEKFSTGHKSKTTNHLVPFMTLFQLQAHSISARQKKQRKEEQTRVPRSLFDRPSAQLLKIRREHKQKSGLLKPFRPVPPPIVKPNVDTADHPEWLIHEDWALLQVTTLIIC